MSTENAGGTRPPGTLTPAARLAYAAAFEAIADGRNRDAAMALRGLDDAQLEELAVICGDVRVMAEAEQRRRDDPPKRDVLDEIDEAVARITDAEIGDRLRELLGRAGYRAGKG